MERQLPPFVLAERDALIAEVYEAFAGVSREGGVSWKEAEIADAYGRVQSGAHVYDADTRWQDLLDAKANFPGSGIGVWPFLEAVGFRYYLPAAMTLSVRSGNDETICFPLTLQTDRLDAFPGTLWSLLNLRQRQCVKRFLHYMTVIDALGWQLRFGSDWAAALESYWQAIPDENGRFRDESKSE
jgi:hypothetical protein